MGAVVAQGLAFRHGEGLRGSAGYPQYDVGVNVVITVRSRDEANWRAGPFGGGGQLSGDQGLVMAAIAAYQALDDCGGRAGLCYGVQGAGFQQEVGSVGFSFGSPGGGIVT